MWAPVGPQLQRLSGDVAGQLQRLAAREAGLSSHHAQQLGGYRALREQLAAMQQEYQRWAGCQRGSGLKPSRACMESNSNHHAL